MAVKLKCGAIFLHIPKTGGTFIEHVLQQLGIYHSVYSNRHSDVFRSLYPQDYKSIVLRAMKEFPLRIKNRLTPFRPHDWTQGPRPNQPTLNDIPYMFCFVRHPVQWIESYFRYCKRLGWPHWSTKYDYAGFWHPNAALNDIQSDDFNTFVGNLLRIRPGYVTEMYGWYTQPGVRFVGKTENLRNDLINVLSDLGYRIDESIIWNATPEKTSDKSIRVEWDADLKKQFLQAEYAALCRYGYL